MDRGAWWARVYRVAKGSDTALRLNKDNNFVSRAVTNTGHVSLN